MFRLQLRALLRASVHGNLRIMFPMISGVAELRAAKRLLAEVREELRREGAPVRDDIPVGIMIELPSAALVADRLARECDFFSIGTNDLIQYAIGIDRQNKDVAYLYKPLHLAVVRMLKTVCDAGKAAGIPVSMCGEMAGEPMNALVLIGLGVSELSMNGPAIPFVKRIVRAARASDGRALVERDPGAHDGGRDRARGAHGDAAALLGAARARGGLRAGLRVTARGRPPARPLAFRGRAGPPAARAAAGRWTAVRHIDRLRARRVTSPPPTPPESPSDAADRLSLHLRVRHRRPSRQDGRSDLGRGPRRGPRAGPEGSRRVRDPAQDRAT